ncbi:MAG: hypothetical protein AMXMBFR64_63110 [Myxococcales bacterium]
MSSHGIERYEVHKAGVAALIRDALVASGARIVTDADPNWAPLVFHILTPRGEALELICYAFHANRYRQGGRPKDEHRFQIKYGSDFHRYHDIFIASGRSAVTLMFGVHEDAGIFVAVDPTMHNPTWFSTSIELKDHHIDEAQRGWAGWERERKAGGRRKAPPPRAEEESWMTEVLLGFTPENFLRYVQFERLATGLDPGERLLTIDRLATVPEGTGLHPLERELGMTAPQILDMIGDAFRLKVAVRGGAAEYHLRKHLEAIPGMSSVELIDQDGKPDFRVVYGDRPPVFVECKNVLRRQPGGVTRVDFQRTRAAKGEPCSRYYKPDDFQLLAACLHPISEKWDFRFASTGSLPAHPKCPGRLSDKVTVAGPAWTNDITLLLGR